MPEADRLYTPSRRRLLAQATGLVSAGLVRVPATEAGVPPGSDAELIRLCEAYRRAVNAFNAVTTYPPGLSHEEQNRLDDVAYEPIVVLTERLAAIPARGMAGVLAEARMAVFCARQPDGEMMWENDDALGWAVRVVHSVLRVQGEVA